MNCINPHQERCAYRVAGHCLYIGGPPPQCVREGQTPAPETNEPPKAEIVQQAQPAATVRTPTDVTDEVLRALTWMKRDMDYRREQTGMSETISPEMLHVNQIIAEMQAGTLQVTRVLAEH